MERAPTARRPVAVWIFLAVSAGLITAHELLPAGSPAQALVFQAAGVAAVVAVLVGMRRHGLGRQPYARAFLAGLVLLAGGDALWNLYDHVLEIERPFPSVGDWVYLGGYAAILAAVLFLLRSRQRPQLSDVLDGAIVLVASASVLWLLLMEPVATDAGLSVAARALSTAFPAADVLMLVGLAQLLASGSARGFAFASFALGMAALFATDVLYGLTTLAGTYQAGGWLDPGWMLATSLWGAALLHPSARGLHARPPLRAHGLTGPRLLFLAGAALVLPLLVALHSDSSLYDHTLMAVAAGVTTLLVFARMTLLFREHRRAVAALRDAEARRALDEAVVETSARFERAAQALECAIYEWDTERSELVWSDGLSDAFGHPPGLVSSSNSWFLDQVHPDDRDAVAQTLGRVRAGADRGEHIYRFRAGDGSYREVWDRWLARRDAQGRLVGVVGGIVDVTERRQLERQLRQAQKMEAVGRLAGGVAHDFNNLLLAIRGNAELLQLELAADAGRHEVCEIVRAADRAAELTRQLLAFSRADVDDEAAVDLNAAVADADSLLRRVLSADIEIETVLAPGVGAVACDAVGIEQVVLNLALNARDAMPAGGSLRIETSIEGDVAVLAVADTGTGMDAETARRAFEPFFTTKEVGKGTGLGLATVYAIAERAGGSVELSSAPGAGTRFRVLLPLAELAAVAERPQDASVPGGSELVLVVEDNASVRGLVTRMLEAGGYDVVAAEGPKEAFARFEDDGFRPDLVVTDLVMPVLGGAALAERLAALRPGLRFLFISGYSETRAELLGPHALLRKPFTSAELAQAVRDALGGVPHAAPATA